MILNKSIGIESAIDELLIKKSEVTAFPKIVISNLLEEVYSNSGEVIISILRKSHFPIKSNDIHESMILSSRIKTTEVQNG